MEPHELVSPQASRLTRLRGIAARLREKGAMARLREKLSFRRRLLRLSNTLRYMPAMRRMGVKSPNFPPINANPFRICKICGAAAKLIGSVDFNKSCETAMGMRLPKLGVPITYLTCTSCEFVFTEDFDTWLHEEYRDFIYNADYKIVDPDYKNLRPRETAKKIKSVLGDFPDLSILDYGGGNGLLTHLLCEQGFRDVTTYDPFNPDHAVLPNRQFDLVTCFETFEHVPEPQHTVDRLASFLKNDAALIFSTFLRGRDFDRKGLDWWYIAPRNGHISIFSTQALQTALAPLSWSSSRIDCTTHIAWRGTPSFFTPHLCQYFNIEFVEGQYAPCANQTVVPSPISWRDLLPHRSAPKRAA